MQHRSEVAPQARVYRVDYRSQQVFEAGALLFVLMAFPDETRDDDRFAELHSSLCADLLLKRARSDPDWALEPLVVKPAQFARPEKLIRKDLRTFDRRMRDRMIAGRVANAIISDAAGLSPRLPKGCEGFSTKQLIKLALDDLERSDAGEHADAENAEQRIWRAGLPVAHLAAATQAFLKRPDNADSDISYGDIIWDPDAIGWIISRAAQTRALMAAAPDRFKSRRPPVEIQLIV